MAPCKLWFWVTLSLGLGGCSQSSFSPAESLPKSLQAPQVNAIDYDLSLRCKAKVTEGQNSETTNCHLWVGDHSVRLELSYPLVGVLLIAELKQGHVQLIKGPEGAISQISHWFPQSLLSLPTTQLKALLLGRRLNGVAAFEGPGWLKTLFLETPQGGVECRYKRWFTQQGLKVPRVIEIRSGDLKLKLVSLGVQLGQGL